MTLIYDFLFYSFLDQGAIWPALSPCTVINPILLTYISWSDNGSVSCISARTLPMITNDWVDHQEPIYLEHFGNQSICIQEFSFEVAAANSVPFCPKSKQLNTYYKNNLYRGCCCQWFTTKSLLRPKFKWPPVFMAVCSHEYAIFLCSLEMQHMAGTKEWHTICISTWHTCQAESEWLM